MNIEQQRNFLETLGYTIKTVDVKHIYPETRSSDREEKNLPYLIAFKGEEPIFESTYGNTEREPNNFNNYDFYSVAKKEAENLMYQIMMDKISENMKGLLNKS